MRKVSEIIYNASKGSKFFNHEESRDRDLTERVERITKEKDRLEKMDLSQDIRRADAFLAELELTRDLSQFVVHVDCDAFFAAVEELDRPELKAMPMAVGKGVLSTCNYEARKYGCRSAMASFVAKKLCPQLVLVPPNYKKYSAKASEIREVFTQYDPLFESASIDEAYLNFTAYCAENQIGPEEAVQRMRTEIQSNTSISVSAGIAPNTTLAKIASNRNKPNGQFRVANDRDSIMEFIRDLPVRKINGVGRVLERELTAIGVTTCGSIYQNRGILARLFGEKAFEFLMHRYLGLGRTHVQPVENYERKSVGNETTFSDMDDKTQIREKLWWAAEELEKDLARTQFKGRTVVLKVKLHTFEVLTRQTAPPRALTMAKDLYNYALPMLSKLEKDIPGMKLRLLGLRCTNLVSTKKVGIDFFGAAAHAKHENLGQKSEAENNTDNHERKDMEELKMSATKFDDNNDNDDEFRKDDPSAVGSGLEPVFWDCPICTRPQLAENRMFNDHVDFCLSKHAIKEAVQSVSSDISERSLAESRKRRSMSNSEDPRQKRLFFR